MPGMQQGGGESCETGFSQQVRFDSGLFCTVIAERPSGCVFGCRYLNAGSMDPDRSAMQEMLDLPTERFDQMPRAFRREANEVNHHVWLQRPDSFPEGAATFFLRAIELEVGHELP